MKKSKRIRSRLDMEAIYEIIVSICPHVVQVFGFRPDDQEVMVEFSPYQGIKIITEDCVPADPLPDWFINEDQLIEVRNSAWLSALKLTLSENDHDADFLDKAKHFVLPTQGAEIQIIASGYTLKKVKIRQSK